MSSMKMASIKMGPTLAFKVVLEVIASKLVWVEVNL